MSRETLLEKISEIVMDVTDTEDVVLTNESQPKDVEDWDSLNHIQIIVGIEKEFKIRFSTQEIQNFKNVGDVATLVEQKAGLN